MHIINLTLVQMMEVTQADGEWTINCLADLDYLWAARLLREDHAETLLVML